MMSQMLVNILFWFFFLPFKLYFLWVNYKGRFKYGLWERSPFWRKLDKRIGVFSLVFDFLLSIATIIALSALIVLAFSLAPEIALSFVLFGAIGWTSVNMAFDKINVDAFEKNCLQCKHKKDCSNFHHEKCISEPIKQLSKSAILYEEKPSKEKKGPAG